MEDETWITNLSNLFYKYTSDRIGQEGIIRMRQMMVRIGNITNFRADKPLQIASGSRSEGFEFPSSDKDVMLVYNKIIVLQEHSSILPPLPGRVVLIMETDQTRPGFCILRLIFNYPLHSKIYKFCAQYQNGVYLASALWRNEMGKAMPESTMHGSCENGYLIGFETDVAHCLKCDWPRSAIPCINRLSRARWPSQNTLTEIVRSGCHLVAIGDKLSDKEILEWRISFSAAETALIHQMNYCQFLCYGLLKIFLKEVINTNQSISDLLCSYFLKTAIFWEIITTRSTWSKKDFLARFWDCFRRLISWVENGYCPNFFIPENNMFLGKIYGRVQRRLLDHLLSLYNKGYNCIPVCNCTPCTMILANPQMFALKFIDFNIDKIDYDINLLNKFCHLLNNIGTSDFSTLLMKMSSLQHIRMQNEVAPWSNGILAFSLELELLFSSMNYIIDALHVSSNKVTYHSVCKYVTAFRRHRFDLSTNNLLSALALYKLGMYPHASRILIQLRARLQQSLCIHSCCTDRVRYEAAGGELYPPDVMMRKAFLIPLRLMECPVPELDLEHQNLNINITYHPTVFMNFLLFLSYFRMSMFEDADSVIHDLTTFIKKENTIETFSPVSFEMLGIC